MVSENVTNSAGIRTSLQVSKMGTITGGDNSVFEPGVNFLVKNITEENVTVTIVPSSNADSDSISTVLTPGWNPEICKRVINAPANTLQYGY